ncbi:MAG: hypothetical protein AAF513_03375 [Pseudomonadota bacterium]
MKIVQTLTQRGVRALSAVALTVMLAACGGGGGSSPNFFGAPDPDGPSGGTGGGTGGTGGGTGGGTETVASFGAVINSSFVEGAVNIAVENLSAGGMTDVTVNIQDQNGNAITDTLTFNFTSACVADGTATLQTNIETSTGQATAEYTANGCVGNDEIRATVVFGTETLTAIGTVTVEQEGIGSLEFVDASPSQIALSGTGGDETSRVTFRVVGQAGAPISGATVTFALNSTTGGLSLEPETALSNSAGEVSTVVQAGSIATSVRVTATEQSTNVSTQSSQLVVSTGIPDQDSFSLSAENCLIEGFDRDGEEMTLTVRAADAFNNPVPADTSISFYTEGGSIDPSCTTNATGACQVTWRSQNPRPDDGIVSILASAIGNESFTDQNGNGRFEDAEFDPDNDIGEAFADENHNDAYDIGEFFIDFGEVPNGMRDGPDGAYNGVLCADGSQTLCSTSTSVSVFTRLTFVMSGSSVVETVLFATDGTPIASSASGAADTITVSPTAEYRLRLADARGNTPAAGTTYALSVSAGFEINGSGSGTIQEDCGPTAAFVPSQTFGVDLTPSSTEVSGRLTLVVTSPSGARSIFEWPLSV